MKKLLSIVLIFGLVCSCDSNKKKSVLKAEPQDQSDWVVIFDGTSTSALRGYGMDEFPQEIWYVENGALIANPDTTNRDLITKERFKDFELEYEWAVDTAANSGVFFHMQEDLTMESGNGNSPNWLDNYELQILDDENFYDTLAVRSAGSLYDLIKPVNKELKPIGNFNRAKLIHNNGHVEHWLNGKKIIDFTMDSPEMRELLGQSKFKENPEFHSDKEGHIMFQHHGQRVYFKNIRVRRLEP
ncbi:DUF1080 domain-containing protein [Maribacter algicola]|uniref:DUF1080 domain-containing protein n=1 Tax=Maribacter algicola TaxID=2498892 RepID=A0A426RHN7_9FLAO|nr:DUF1080 domain-containing protein [Maribacter algicola]RRQ48504.1 DUF1080 domain-containing protein [Maribacter algicola]